MTTSDEALRRFGERLRSVRAAMSLNQQEFAEIGGVKKNSQVAYEGGKTPANVEYLYRLADRQVDIGYVLTGRKLDGSLGFEDKFILDMFSKLSSREREAMVSMLAILTGSTTDLVDQDALAAKGRAQREQLEQIGQASVHSQRQAFKGRDE
ncbi:hypothetical protein DBR17_04900 [Sphingomonas sp. HMWF008]|nr:hypothetical protein DBR17_04900 [Sphingomonas sp. HMWF008]